jgi:mannitol-1-/sugar-/sorbitol-6-/2-deoxyglucose-6-phosphatase
MLLTTVIFDMDGLLIDSEPCWQEAGMETLREFNIVLSKDQYHLTTGLRTKEWIDYWFGYAGIGKEEVELAKEAEKAIHRHVIEKIKNRANPMPGIDSIFSFFRARKFKIGLATSSPLSLVDVVVNKLGIGNYLEAATSAEYLPFGKPHPQVYMDCAQALNSSPLQCIAFEDSFNGLIAAKAARMKCVIIPDPTQYFLPKWEAADLKLNSLLEFRDEHFDRL